MTGAAAAFVSGGGSSIAVTLNPTSVSGFGNSGASANVTTGNVTATPSGGVAPYTFAWAQKGGSGNTWTIGSAAAATTSFTCQALAAGATDETLFEVTVTDSLGSKGKATVDAFANNGQPYRDTPDSRLAGVNSSL